MHSPPVLLILFNREDTTKKVFEAIRKNQPSKLFLAADGPRPGVPTDQLSCELARRVVEVIDWPCEVHRRFLTKNVGCGRGPAEAITWFFENVEEGIILEDDCLPDQSFFRFAGEMLERYREDKRVMHISGDNFLRGKRRGNASYYFSKWTFVWGWATWRRAWKKFDFNLLPESERNHIWDAQWRMSVENANGLSIVPNQNLVKNLGFAHPLATHTTEDATIFSNLPLHSLNFPLEHPLNFEKTDRYFDSSPLRNENSFYELTARHALYGIREFLVIILRKIVSKDLRTKIRKKFESRKK